VPEVREVGSAADGHGKGVSTALEGESYTTVRGRSSAEVTEKKSRFIAALAPAATEEEALAFLEGVRAEHRMAKHHVFAYVLRAGGRVRYSDDGEPSRTAGLPVLEAINHAGLTDVVVVVTRYFGGTLLGTGGLVRAYTQAAQAAIAHAETVAMSRCVDIELDISYADYDQVIRLAGLSGAKVVGTSFSDTVHLCLRTRAEETAIVEKLTDLLKGSTPIVLTPPYTAAFEGTREHEGGSGGSRKRQ